MIPQLSLVLTQDQTVSHVKEPSVKLILQPWSATPADATWSRDEPSTLEKQRTETPGRKDSPGWNCSRVESGTDSDSQDFPLSEVNQPSQESRGIANCQ